MFTFTKWFSALILVLAVVSSAAQAKPLSVESFTSNGAGFHVTSTLISGEKEALLVDGQFTLSAAHRLTAQILESGKELKAVFITHAHPDHYFGLEVIKAQFPKVRVLAAPEVVEQMKTMGPEKLAAWKPMYGNNLTSAPIVAEPYSKKTLELEGETIEIHQLQPGEIEYSSVLFIPATKTVIAGDLAYNGIHPWLAEANAERRKQWIENLEFVASLNPEVVIAGHKLPEADNSPAALEFTKDYVKFFDQVVAETKDPEAAKAKILAKYPNLGLPIILDLAVQAAFGSVTHQH